MMFGSQSRMLFTVSWFDSRFAVVNWLSFAKFVVVTLSRFIAARVAAMLRSMYGFSFVDSDGSTWNFWTRVGTIVPATTATNAHSPTLSTGNTHPLRKML